MWKISLNSFLKTLPVVQLANSLTSSDRWIQDNNNNILTIKSCISNIKLNDLYEERVSVRTAICNQSDINCFSFLQPMAGSSGNQLPALLSNEKSEIFKKKYNLLKQSNGIIDLRYLLENTNELSYIDGVHYSPKTNEIIAKELFKYLN